MKRVLAIFLLVSLLSTVAFSEFAIMKIEERVKSHNLIVIGKLSNISETDTKVDTTSSGTLIVEKLVYGNFRKTNRQTLKIGDTIQVQWTNSKMIACKFGFPENESEIWFLNVDNEGKVEPLSPSSTATLNEMAEIKKYIKKKKNDLIVRKIQTESIIQKFNQPKQLSTESETVECLYSVKESTQKENSLFFVLTIILATISLYYFLYRSKFKIR